MNAKCPHCATVFRVDAAKIPAAGVRARCSICRGVFSVQREPAPLPDGVSAPSAPPKAADAALTDAAALREAGIPAASPAAREADEALAPSAPVRDPAATVGSAPSAADAAALFAGLGGTDPDAKARRLARALASDIATYFPDRRERALSQGTLRAEFREEITKSWKEYVEQVGAELAHGTTHFRDALNEILARGQRVF